MHAKSLYHKLGVWQIRDYVVRFLEVESNIQHPMLNPYKAIDVMRQVVLVVEEFHDANDMDTIQRVLKAALKMCVPTTNREEMARGVLFVTLLCNSVSCVVLS